MARTADGPTTGEADTDGEAGLSPEEAFGLLADETRQDILRVLGEATDDGAETLPFAELRRRVGVRDAGRFNYHLDKLRGHFVAKTEDGYALRYAGQMVVAAILAGTYTGRGADREAETSYSCPDCGDPLVASYTDQELLVECPEHAHQFWTQIPPGASEGRSVDALVRLAARRARQLVERARDDVCPVCWGRMDTWLSLPEATDGAPHARFDCERCWMDGTAEMSAWIAGHPAVTGFLHDHGVAIDEATLLDSVYLGSRDAVRVVSEEPPRVRLALDQGEDRLEVIIDEGANVADVTTVQA